jgi:hypothetical protein
MTKKLLSVILLTSFSFQFSYAQSLAVNTDGLPADASALLDVRSSAKGLLIPRLTTIQRTGIITPATSLMVYDTDLNQYYFYNGTAWAPIASGSNYWTLLSGNIYNNTGTNIGIGVTAPGEKLEVNGNIRLTGTGTIYTGAGITNLSIHSGDGTASGGAMSIRGGNAGSATGGAGGDVTIQAGNNVPQGGSGYTNLGLTGMVNIFGGSGYNSSGGNINIKAGATSCWALPGGNHSDVILSGGLNLASTDASTITVEGGYTIGTTCPSPGATGGNLLLKPGVGSGTGNNGSIQLDGAVALGISMNLAGGTVATPVSLTNKKAYIGLSPADGTNNNYQLPSAILYPGRMYIIRNNSSLFSANLTTAGAPGVLLFNGSGSAGFSTYGLNPTTSAKTVMAISDGSNWTIMKMD